MLPFVNVLWFARAGSRLSSGFLLPGISLACPHTHVCVCELVFVQAHTACLQRRARATRRPARRWYRHGAAGWAAFGAGDGLALATAQICVRTESNGRHGREFRIPRESRVSSHVGPSNANTHMHDPFKGARELRETTLVVALHANEGCNGRHGKEFRNPRKPCFFPHWAIPRQHTRAWIFQRCTRTEENSF